MKIIVYSSTTKDSIRESLGAPEYSYYFVLNEYLPVLEKIGTVIRVAEPQNEVDAIYEQCQSRKEQCVFLSFTPPDKTLLNLRCPTIPVFAWEFYNLPDEAWDDNASNDWRYVLGRAGWAITHSQFTVNTIHDDMRADYPTISIPAPVWDRFKKLYNRSFQPQAAHLNITVQGRLLDSENLDLHCYSPLNDTPRPHLPEKGEHHLTLKGIIYTSILNPNDGRKNWLDMVWAFCWAFKEEKDATLVLKLTHYNAEPALNSLLYDLYKLTPFQCRVVVIDGYLSDEDYESLARQSSYTVNSSRGEGQCLPLMEYMSCGKPAIAPNHTGMADYVNERNSFIVASSLEPSHWPHDPRQAYKTLRYRIDWESLLNAFTASFQVATKDIKTYRRMSMQASKQLQLHCSRKTAKSKLKKILYWQKLMQSEFRPKH